MARGAMPPNDEFRTVTDDYVIERDDERRGTPFVILLVQTLRFLLILLLAALSLSLFWLVGAIVGLF